jgi:hypothetical protein
MDGDLELAWVWLVAFLYFLLIQENITDDI